MKYSEDIKMEYTAEQYLERIENKRLKSTPLYSREEMIDFAKKYAKQLTIPDVVQATPEKVCELILKKFDCWVFGLETQSGKKLKVVDSADFNEIITEIESEIKGL